MNKYHVVRCEYCSRDKDEQLEWRADHRVVSYLTYRVMMIIAMAVSLYVGFVIGTKWE